MWHDVLDRVDIGDTERGRRFLYVCGRWNSEKLLSAPGRLADSIPPIGSGWGGGKPACTRCNRSDHDDSRWMARKFGIRDELQRPYLQRGEDPNDNKLHFILRNATFTSDEDGEVYLTSCGRWVHRTRVRVLRRVEPAPKPSRVCGNCLRFDVEGAEPGDPESATIDDD